MTSPISNNKAEILISSSPHELDPIEYVCEKINKAIYRGLVREKFISRLKEKRNLNIQVKGWTLLHYCFYIFSWTSDKLDKSIPLVELIWFLVKNGADINALDRLGRPPLYFFSRGDMEEPETGHQLVAFQNTPPKKMRKVEESIDRSTCQTMLLKEVRALIEENQVNVKSNGRISGLHIVAISPYKSVKDLIELGADPFETDKFGRTPLHCAATNELDRYGSSTKTLLEIAPQTTEWKDSFGHYPLYYALIFGSEEAFKLIVSYSSVRVIDDVIEVIKQIGVPESIKAQYKLLQEYEFENEIYEVGYLFVVHIGGGKKETNKKEKILQKLEEEKKNKIINTFILHQGNKIYYHHDKHGFKHLASPKEYDNKKKKEFINKSISQPAKFYPDVVHSGNYDEWLYGSIQNWINNGADNNMLSVENATPVGAAAGKETNKIGIYFSGELGAHIRPLEDKN